MKGIAHFISGVAVASMFPVAMDTAASGNPLLLVLGGICGILPDTLDFKFYRFFYKHDLYIEPDALKPDAQSIADQLAVAIDLAGEERMYLVKCCTIRLGADLWQQYNISFDAIHQCVEVSYGPVVNTGQMPITPKDEALPSGLAVVASDLLQTYDSAYSIDIFDGPSFGFQRESSGKVALHFLPWHREWTHSLTLGGLLAMMLAAIAYPIGGLALSGTLAAMTLGAFVIHIVEDQLGFMGSNLFYPFTKKRWSGLHIMRSGDALPNFSAVWFSILIIFWNCYSTVQPAGLNWKLIPFFFMLFILPLGLTLICRSIRNIGRLFAWER